MTVTDQIKILEKKLSRTSSSNDLVDKYEYLTGKDLGVKPSTIEHAKFEYSPLGKVFTKGLNEDDEKEGLFKGLKNIEDNTEELLKIKKKD